MSGSVNKVILVGRVGADPEIKRFNNGDPVANIRLAVSESWRDKNSGERKEKTEWVNVVIYNENLVKVAESYVKKGHLLYVEGALQTRSYEKDGEKKLVTEVVLQKFRGELQMLSNSGEGGQDSRPAPSHQGGYGATKTGTGTRVLDDGDDLPFQAEFR